MREELIRSYPFIMMGKPVVAGTRITVELILCRAPAVDAGGHPGALAFAARALRAVT